MRQLLYKQANTDKSSWPPLAPASEAKPAPELTTLPKKYQDFADVFEKKNADVLFGPIYSLSEPEAKALYE